MINILHMVPKLDVGGIEQMLYNVYSNVDTKLYHFDFIVYGDEIGIIEKRFLSLNSKVFHVTPKKKNFLKYCLDIATILSNNNYDIVHVHQSNLSYIPLFLSMLLGKKVRIAHAHTYNPYSEGAFHKVEMFLNRLFSTDRLACGLKAGEWCFGNKSTFKIFYNGIDTSLFKYNVNNRFSLRKKYNVSNDKLVLGCVGRLSEEKNIFYLIEIMKCLDNNNKNYALYIIGDGENKKQILKKIKDYKLESKIVLLGNRDDINKYYSFFDILLMPSIFEGFPVVSIEAQCSDLPILLSANISNEAVINKNVQRLPIGSDDIEIWVNNILNLSISNREHFNEKLVEFDIKKTVEVLCRFYRESVNKN